jgi:hypothetical protein
VDWIRGFLKRKQLSIQKATSASKKRTAAENPDYIKTWFAMYKKVREGTAGKREFASSRLWTFPGGFACRCSCKQLLT